MSSGNLCKNQGRGKGGFIENLNLETIEEVHLLDKFLYNLHWFLWQAIGGEAFCFVVSNNLAVTCVKGEELWLLHWAPFSFKWLWCPCPPVFATCSSLDGVLSRVCGHARCQILWQLSLPRLVVLGCPVEQKWGCCPACKRQAVISAGRIKAFVMWTVL